MEEKALTLSQLIKYNEEILIPQFEDKFVLKNDFNEFKNKTLTGIDSMLKKMEELLEEKDVRIYQKEKERKFFAIMIKAMEEHNILSSEELQKISQLNIL